MTTEKGQTVAVGSDGLLAARMQTALVFAARYTHNRTTGGTLAVVCALESCWHQLTKQTQEQILREASRDAITNKDDWERLRLFAANVQSEPRSQQKNS